MHRIARRLITVILFVAALAAGSVAAVAGIAIVGSDGQQIYPPPNRGAAPEANTGITYAKHALVVGVSNYKHVTRIKNAAHDAALISTTLDDLGFEVVTVLNPGLQSFRSAVSDYARSISSGNTISVVYFAGHGVQIGGVDYLIPADARPESAGDLDLGSIAVAELINSLSEVPVEQPVQTRSPYRAQNRSRSEFMDGAKLFFIDASRNNPFASGELRSSAPVANPGLARAAAFRIGTAVMYAASDGAEAMDGDGENGPFALALAAQLRSPGLEVTEIFRRVRDAVIESTAGRQVPVSYDNLAAKLILNHDETTPSLSDEPPEMRAAKVLFRRADGNLEPTYADGSYALLIGVGDYKEFDTGRQAWKDLEFVEDELARLSGVLEQVHGFEVQTVFDPTGDELEAALENFVNLHGPKPDARLMIMMSGHGTTTERYGRKTAWFVPADAPATEPPAPFLNTALNLRRVEEWSEIMAAKHVMWIFDSCFSGAAIRMIERKAADTIDGWTEHLHRNPVRRVLTAGSENEEVPAKSRFTETLIRVLSGQESVDGAGDYITGQQLGVHLKQDIIRYNFRLGLPRNTPQSDTIVIPGEEGDVVFSIDPELSARWASTAD